MVLTVLGLKTVPGVNAGKDGAYQLLAGVF